MIEKKRKHKSKPIDFLRVIHPTAKIPSTFGQRAADVITTWAGSWTFILTFVAFFILWMIVNTSWIIFGQTWDIYPFILLNLVLSCVAAIQAPVILMSQNREANKDRLKAQYDYAVNRKAEREIQELQDEIRDIKNILLGKKNTGKIK